MNRPGSSTIKIEQAQRLPLVYHSEYNIKFAGIEPTRSGLI